MTNSETRQWSLENIFKVACPTSKQIKPPHCRLHPAGQNCLGAMASLRPTREWEFAFTLCVFVYSWGTCSSSRSIAFHESFIKADESDFEGNRAGGKRHWLPKQGALRSLSWDSKRDAWASLGRGSHFLWTPTNFATF